MTTPANDDLASRRVQYQTDGLDADDLAPDPISQWRRWYADASAARVAEPNAMTVATVGADGVPDARVVLCRGTDDESLVFYTNYHSAKSAQLDTTPAAAAVFAWLDLHRQVRVRGRVERVAADESDVYFSSRPRGSQISAWASPQSQVLADRAELDRLFAESTRRFGEGDVPRPHHWGGWRLVVDTAEFWQGRPSRLHDRLRYRRNPAGGRTGGWIIERLAP